MDSQNILDKYENFNIRYVLLAFANTSDACNTDKGPSVGKPGTVFSGNGCGKQGIVVINEFEEASYVVEGFWSDFNYYSNINDISTQMVGELSISDRLGGQFPTFLRNCAQLLDVSETHIAFQLKIYFVGVLKNGQGVETYVTKPLIFNQLFLTQSLQIINSHMYYLSFAATYNTFGLFNMFSRMYQTTITSFDRNPSKEIPKPDAPMSTIIPRGQEDSMKESLRKVRIDKSKPMETFDDVFKSLQEDLNQQKYVHQRQLQEWLSFIKDDYTKKIDKPVQHKPPGNLPLEYEIILDPEYKSYKVDNRNMPFEQPEQSQDKYGIRVIPIAESSHILEVMRNLMKLSQRTGKDGNLNPKKTYKIVATVVKTCDEKYKITYRIKKIILPTNSPSSIDTGPGDAVDPISLEFQKDGVEDADVFIVTGRSGSISDLDVVEKQVNDTDAKIIYGDREQETAERTVSVDFFKSMFSGLRPIVNNLTNGLENAEDASKADILNIPSIYSQNTKFEMKIRGNPELLSDLFRNPVKVVSGDPDSPRFYTTPEYSPMYAKIIIYLDPLSNSLGLKKDDSDNVYYYIKYYHLYKVRTVIDGNEFSQYLTMLRSDDAT